MVNKTLYIIFVLILSFQFAVGQEVDSLGKNDTTKFYRINNLIDKIKTSDKFDYFRQINQSKVKAEFNSTAFKEVQHLEGRKIRSIEIVVLDPLGQKIDTTKKRSITQFSNRLHQTTPEKFVRRELLFDVGDELSISDLVRTERSLYDHPNFREAGIEIIEFDDDTYVDIWITVQDIWSWTFYGRADGTGLGGNLIFNKFLGRPQQLNGGLDFKFDRNNPISPSLFHNVRNVLGSRLDTRIIWRHDWYEYQYSFRVQRNFFASKRVWAGSFEFDWNRRGLSQEDNTYFNTQDLWLAKALPASSLEDKGLRLLISSRAFRRQFTSRVLNDESGQRQVFDNHKFFLGGIGLASERFYKETELFEFDRRNILPRGLSLTVIGGWDMHALFDSRGMLGGNISYGIRPEKAGYFYWSGQATTYLQTGLLSEVGMNYNFNYISPRVSLGKWKMRSFIYQEMSHSWNLPENKDVVLSPDNVKALRLREYDGSSRYSINFETAFFTPKRIIGFRGNLFVFADLGLQGKKSNNILNQPRLYQAYGFGMRLNNWHLGIGYLEIAFAYYTDIENSFNTNAGIVQKFYNDKVISDRNLFGGGILSPR